jgi:hypothetical protein
MLRTMLACAVTAAVTALTMAALGEAGTPWAGTPDRSFDVSLGSSATFAGQDLICVNEFAGRRRMGVACSSSVDPYRGLGVWFTSGRLVVTKPPNGRMIADLRR